MANDLGYYDPYFYAQEGLMQLEKALGMAGRVHLGYDRERRSFGKGQYVNISRPTTFTAQDAPVAHSSAEDLDPDEVQVQLSEWKEVKFGLTDKELAFTKEKMINDHIRPMAVALADNIDQALVTLYQKVPWSVYVATATALASTDITSVYKKMFDNACPMRDLDWMNFMLGGKGTKDMLDANLFASWSTAGQEAIPTVKTGFLGQRLGFNFFSNQNSGSHTAGTCADATGAIDLGAGYSAGDTTIHIDGVTDGGTAKAGDALQITGHTQEYCVQAAVTFTGGEGDVTIYPGLEADTVDDTVVKLGNAGTMTSGNLNLAFHRNAFALVTAPLSDVGAKIGAKVARLYDPITGLSLRSRIYYDGETSKTYVAMDVLYGYTILDDKLACRVIDTD